MAKQNSFVTTWYVADKHMMAAVLRFHIKNGLPDKVSTPLLSTADVHVLFLIAHPYHDLYSILEIVYFVLLVS